MKTHQLTIGLAFCMLCSLGTVQAAGYYWVGGSVNWLDLSHWATTSGGPSGHIQVPYRR